MIVLRRGEERTRERTTSADAWLTFTGNSLRPEDEFGALNSFREGRFFPNPDVRVPLRESEIITYVRSGSLAFETSLGQTGILHQGDFQRMTAGAGLHYGESNVSREQEAHVFQIQLRPQRPGMQPSYQKRHFSEARRRGRLCRVASSNGDDATLTVHREAALFSGILAPGQHVVHTMPPGHGVWLHVVEGALTLGSTALGTGDAIGITQVAAAAMTIGPMTTEILLLDLGDFAARANPTNGASL